MGRPLMLFPRMQSYNNSELTQHCFGFVMIGMPHRTKGKIIPWSFGRVMFIILIVCAVCITCEAVSFTSSPGVVMTYVGDSATFNWRVDDSVDISNSVVEFRYTGIPGSDKRIYERVADRSPIWYNGYESRTVVTYSSDNHGLGFTLSQIQTSDTGNNLPYVCLVTYLGKGMNDDDAKLFIYGQPSVPTITPNPPKAVEGASYSLTCSTVTSSIPAGLAPGMTYTWTRDGAPLPTDRHSVDGGELTINPVDRQDHQRAYSCQAREINSTLSNSENIQLDVKYSPGNPILAEPTAPIVVGSSLILTCVVSSPGNPATYTYTWRNNGTFSRTTSGNSMTVDDVIVEDHDGAWRCEVNNSVGTVHSGEIVVIVNAPAEISTAPGPHVSVLYSSPLSVLCEVRAKPAASVTWTYNGVDTLPAGVQPMTGNSRLDGKYTVTVSTLQWRPESTGAERRQSGGIYTCRGDNSVGDVATSGDCTLKILYEPVSISLTDHGPITKVEGNEVTVTCSSDCSPSCSYTWSRSGDSGWSQDSATLSFPAINRADHNTYTCVADNDHGSKSASVVINVNFGSEITSFLSSPPNLLHGVDAVLSCSVSSRPDSDVTISYGNTELERGTNPTVELDFTPVSILHSGPYRCNATNGINANPVTGVKPLDVKGGFHRCADQKDSVIRGRPLSVGFLENICQFANPFHQITRANWTFVIRNDTIMSNGLPEDVTIYMMDSDHEHQKTIILNISSISQGHYGTYTLYSANGYGSLEFTLQLTPEGPPVAPSTLVCTKITAVSVYLQWIAGYHGGSEQTFVVIYNDTQTGQSYTKLVDGSEVPQGGTVHHKLTENDGITSSTTYRIQVDAQNADGHYIPGPSVTNTTLARPEVSSEPSITIKENTALIRCEISNIDSISHLNIDACDTKNSANCEHASFTDLEAQPFKVPLPEAGGFLFTFLFYDGIDLVNTEEFTHTTVAGPDIGLIIGVVAGVVLAALVVAVFVILWKKGIIPKEKPRESHNRNGSRPHNDQSLGSFDNPIVDSDDLDSELSPYSVSTHSTMAGGADEISPYDSTPATRIHPPDHIDPYGTSADTRDVISPYGSTSTTKSHSQTSTPIPDDTKNVYADVNKHRDIYSDVKKNCGKPNPSNDENIGPTTRPVSVYPPAKPPKPSMITEPAVYTEINKAKTPASQAPSAGGDQYENVDFKHKKNGVGKNQQASGGKMPYTNVATSATQEGAYSEVGFQGQIPMKVVGNAYQNFEDLREEITEYPGPFVGDDGVTYAQLDMMIHAQAAARSAAARGIPLPRPVIRGSENKTDYASIDHLKTSQHKQKV